VKASDALLTLLAALTSSQGFLLLVDHAKVRQEGTVQKMQHSD